MVRDVEWRTTRIFDPDSVIKELMEPFLKPEE